MHTVVVRVWIPDRPGALGQVASRIGAVRGDVLGIEILEVGGGRVIDELVVALPDEAVVDLMVNEVHAIDGVSVEHVRPTASHTDGGLLALGLAAELAEAEPERRQRQLVAAVLRLTEGAWAMVAAGDQTLVAAGDAPEAEYITALLAGSRHLVDPHAASSEIFWSDLPEAGLWVAAGRDDRPVHERERVRLDLFARIADRLLT